jgi:hypothetical protein
MAWIQITSIGLFLGFGLSVKAQIFIPEASSSIHTAPVMLELSSDPGANRPWARITFKDGFNLDLNAVCEGEYSWCIRKQERGRTVELGSMKMELRHNARSMVLRTRIPLRTIYEKYLNLLPGRYKRME